MKKLTVLMTLIGLALAGCASQPKTTFVRVDGQPFEANPAYQGQFDSDLGGCRENAPSSSLFGIGRSETGDPCMEEKGYVQVTEEQAVAKRAELAAAAEQKRVASQPVTPAGRRRPVARRGAAQPAAKPSRRPARQAARPATAKQKKPPLTNPLKLPD